MLGFGTVTAAEPAMKKGTTASLGNVQNCRVPSAGPFQPLSSSSRHTGYNLSNLYRNGVVQNNHRRRNIGKNKNRYLKKESSSNSSTTLKTAMLANATRLAILWRTCHQGSEKIPPYASGSHLQIQRSGIVDSSHASKKVDDEDEEEDDDEEEEEDDDDDDDDDDENYAPLLQPLQGKILLSLDTQKRKPSDTKPPYPNH